MSKYSLVFDCPSCKAKYVTFTIKGYNIINSKDIYHTTNADWEFFSVCRVCNLGCCIGARLKLRNGSVKISNGNFVNAEQANRLEALKQDSGDVTDIFENIKVKKFILTIEQPPEHIPQQLNIIFQEAVQSLAIDCFNASGAMFRLCLDMVTKDILEKNSGLNPTAQDKKTIHTRLIWIFNNQILPNSLEALSRCIKDDGNDAAHDGTIGKAEAEDLLDFTRILLERVYTEPERIKLAELRRIERRQK